MYKVKVKGMPVFYAGIRFEVGADLTVQASELNEALFEVVEKIGAIEKSDEVTEAKPTPFKGVKEATLKKALVGAGIDIPDGADREALIKLMVENNLTVG